MPIVATDTRLEVENTLGSTITVTAVTKANPGVATATSHGLSNGDVLKITAAAGMVELNGQVVRVANIDTNTFELEGIDTTDFSTWESGTVEEVTAWYTVSQATDIDLGNASPTELDGSTLLSKRTVTLYGRPGAIAGTVSIQHERASANGLAKIKAASVSDVLAFRATYNTGETSLFGGKTAYSGGRTINQNSIITGSIPLTVTGDIVDYAAP